MVIKFKKLYADAKPPVRASDGAVGFDVCAYHVQDKNTRGRTSELPADIGPGESLLIGVGFSLAVPFPTDCQIRPRSGLANRHDIELSNSPGTIDPDFRGEMGILLRNRGTRNFMVEKGMRIAQLIFTTVEMPSFVEIDELPPTSRNQGGFGSTGLFEIGQGETASTTRQKVIDRYFMNIATAASALSNCLRGATKKDGKYCRDETGSYIGSNRRVGCIIVSNGNIVGQGYNAMTIECSEEQGCIRETQSIASGTMLEKGCIHGEEAALANCLQTGVSIKGATVYINYEPCLMCSKLLAHSGIGAVVVPQGAYPTNGLSYIADLGIEIRRMQL